jgi:hypothetical protein
LSTPPSGQTCQTRSSGRRIWPRRRSARVTSTDLTGFGGVSGAASAISLLRWASSQERARMAVAPARTKASINKRIVRARMAF